MKEQTKRFAILAALMIILTASVSALQSYLLYKTALNEQRLRLHELVLSQASLVSELIIQHVKSESDTTVSDSIDNALRHIANAQKNFELKRVSGEFTIAVKNGAFIQYLVVNGQLVPESSPLNSIPLISDVAAPMKKAFNNESGTMISPDYKSREVLAAYTPIAIPGRKYGMVAKIDLEIIKRPFLIVNAQVFSTATVLVFLALILLYAFSDPFFRKLEKSKKNYRELVENINSLILQVDETGRISFANSFAQDLLNPDREETGIEGQPMLALLSGSPTPEVTADTIDDVIRFFGEEGGPYERPCVDRNGSIIWIAWRVSVKRDRLGKAQSILCTGTNITSRHNTLEKLKDSEVRYRNIFENAPLAMVHFNNSGEISDCNDIFLNLMGSDRRRVIGFKSIQNSRPAMREALGRAMEGSPSLFEELYTSVTGYKTTYLRAIFNPVITRTAPYEVIATFEDITQRKKVEQELAESERRFKGIAKASPVGIMITDRSGRMEYANDRMLRICDATYEELQSEGWTIRLHRDDRERIEKIWNADAPPDTDRTELRIIKRDGSLIWVLGQRVELTGSGDDEMTGYVITITDITQVKETELEQMRLITAMDQAAEQILITDISGNIVYVNPAFEEITGYTMTEAMGRKPSILSSGEHDKAYYKEFWQTILSGETWHGRFINRSRYGRIYTQETTVAPVRDEDGRIVSFVSVARDITKQLMVEARLRQSQKLESIGELAAGIAHEINTPTQYVTTNIKFLQDSFSDLLSSLNRLDALRQSLEGDNPLEKISSELEKMIDAEELSFLAEDIPKALEESEQGLERISEIVKSVKQLAHPGESRMSYHNLNGIINDAVTVSSNEWKYSSDIVRELDEDLPDVYCLKGELGQMVLNLIINSAHAIESKAAGNGEKGTITLKSRAGNGSVILEVSDTGCGMPPDVIARAFDPFFTTKEVGKGTGQGLAIAHNVVVNIHKGEIFINSVEGEGTTVTVKLPLSAGKAQSDNDSDS